MDGYIICFAMSQLECSMISFDVIATEILPRGADIMPRCMTYKRFANLQNLLHILIPKISLHLRGSCYAYERNVVSININHKLHEWHTHGQR